MERAPVALLGVGPVGLRGRLRGRPRVGRGSPSVAGVSVDRVPVASVEVVSVDVVSVDVVSESRLSKMVSGSFALAVPDVVN